MGFIWSAMSHFLSSSMSSIFGLKIANLALFRTNLVLCLEKVWQSYFDAIFTATLTVRDNMAASMSRP